MTAYTITDLYVKIHHSGFFTPHTHTVPLNLPGAAPDVGDDPLVTKKGGGTISVSDFLGDYLPILVPMFAETISFSLAEVFYLASGDAVPQWINAFTLTNVGTNGLDTAIFSRLTLTMRTMAGHLKRNVYMETAFVANSTFDFSELPPEVDNLFDYLISADCPIVGYDDTHMLGFVGCKTKTDDRLRAAVG